MNVVPTTCFARICLLAAIYYYYYLLARRQHSNLHWHKIQNLKKNTIKQYILPELHCFNSNALKVKIQVIFKELHFVVTHHLSRLEQQATLTTTVHIKPHKNVTPKNLKFCEAHANCKALSYSLFSLGTAFPWCAKCKRIRQRLDVPEAECLLNWSDERRTTTTSAGQHPAGCRCQLSIALNQSDLKKSRYPRIPHRAATITAAIYCLAMQY